MSDRRRMPFSGRVALESLRDTVEAERYTRGEPAWITVPVCDLCPAPDGPRDRQLVFGAAITVIERLETHAFVQAAWDGYCGWIEAGAAAPMLEPTHIVTARATHLYREASIKRGEVMGLSMGARVSVLREEGGFLVTPEGYLPRPHAAPDSMAGAPPMGDPVAVAEALLGTPYLWGGNSSAGIDCSGLVQIAHLLCGRAVPGDSDMQWRELGEPLAEADPYARGDLIFWKGHVALVCDAQRLIHANGHTMSVAYEPIAECLARIEASGEAPYLGRKRLR
ncbi:Cell wall-associated hydrolase, NlpC family [Thioclava dalianensis]|nr:NlpC/P60 family protein [Thioclava dalianensis]SFM85189.1 Cell wall-associated hydrolase, NlpC family [Thioclava dalianensis]